MKPKAVRWIFLIRFALDPSKEKTRSGMDQDLELTVGGCGPCFKSTRSTRGQQPHVRCRLLSDAAVDPLLRSILSTLGRLLRGLSRLQSDATLSDKIDLCTAQVV